MNILKFIFEILKFVYSNLELSARVYFFLILEHLKFQAFDYTAILKYLIICFFIRQFNLKNGFYFIFQVAIFLLIIDFLFEFNRFNLF